MGVSEKEPTVIATAATPDSCSESVLPFTETGRSSSDELDIQDNYIPDGGLLAWRQVVAGHLGSAVSSGLPATFGVFQLYYTSTFALPAAQISWIGSVQVFCLNCACVVGGRLTDAGFAREAILAGSTLVVIGLVLTSIAKQYWEVLLAQGLCTGLGLGLIWMPSMAVVSSYFKRRRALALALATAGTGTGSMAFPATVQYLMPYIGLLLKPRFAKPKTRGPIIEVGAFKELTFLYFTIGTFLFYWALYFGFFYMNTFAMTLPFNAFTTTSTVSLLLITNGAGTVSRVLTGYLADDHLGPLNAYILAVGAFALVLFTWIAVNSALAMYLWAAAFGFTNGAAQGAFVGALASLTSDPRKIGTRFGMVCGVLAFASLAGPPTAGAILGVSGGWYGWAQIWAGAVEILAMIVLGTAKWWMEEGIRVLVDAFM
ncbi:hypothetical protein DL765_011394 [Monosporascus sp. GIB2]|nr:hypothetical protein DL765_011394 [Monosporascus sp. GIB2]